MGVLQQIVLSKYLCYVLDFNRETNNTDIKQKPIWLPVLTTLTTENNCTLMIFHYGKISYNIDTNLLHNRTENQQ